MAARAMMSATRPDGTPDESRRDYGACIRFLEHHHPDQVAAALRQASPDLARRHSNVEKYIELTVTAAERELERQQQEHERTPRPAFRPKPMDRM
jgi:hypothetical protein